MNVLKSRKFANILLVLMLAQSGLALSQTALGSEPSFVEPPPPNDPIVPTNYSGSF